jgi:hypothetical protein
LVPNSAQKKKKKKTHAHTQIKVILPNKRKSQVLFQLAISQNKRTQSVSNEPEKPNAT